MARFFAKNCGNVLLLAILFLSVFNFAIISTEDPTVKEKDIFPLNSSSTSLPITVVTELASTLVLTSLVTPNATIYLSTLNTSVSSNTLGPNNTNISEDPIIFATPGDLIKDQDLPKNSHTTLYVVISILLIL